MKFDGFFALFNFLLWAWLVRFFCYLIIGTKHLFVVLETNFFYAKK